MSTGLKKAEIITFKVDEALSEALDGIQNRSDFIRNAILSALGNVCPVCHGTGRLSASQMQHWNDFSRYHHTNTCSKCSETYLVCDHE
jgi:hypothetical protein